MAEAPQAIDHCSLFESLIAEVGSKPSILDPSPINCAIPLGVAFSKKVATHNNLLNCVSISALNCSARAFLDNSHPAFFPRNCNRPV